MHVWRLGYTHVLHIKARCPPHKIIKTSIPSIQLEDPYLSRANVNNLVLNLSCIFVMKTFMMNTFDNESSSKGDASHCIPASGSPDTVSPFCQLFDTYEHLGGLSRLMPIVEGKGNRIDPAHNSAAGQQNSH